MKNVEIKTEVFCDMKSDCLEPISMIDEKGYAYCAEHGQWRKSSMRCRKLTPTELKTILSGKPLAEY